MCIISEVLSQILFHLIFTMAWSGGLLSIVALLQLVKKIQLEGVRCLPKLKSTVSGGTRTQPRLFSSRCSGFVLLFHDRVVKGETILNRGVHVVLGAVGRECQSARLCPSPVSPQRTWFSCLSIQSLGVLSQGCSSELLSLWQQYPRDPGS